MFITVYGIQEEDTILFNSVGILEYVMEEDLFLCELAGVERIVKNDEFIDIDVVDCSGIATIHIKKDAIRKIEIG